MAAKMVASHKKKFGQKLLKANTLSMSLPDVSQDPAALEDARSTFQRFTEAPFPPLLSNPARPATTTYNIDDDTWSEKADPNTGFVFHIDSPTKPTTTTSSTTPSPQRGSAQQAPVGASSAGEVGGGGSSSTHPLSVSVSSSSLSSTQSATETHSHTAPASPSTAVNTPLGFAERRFTQSLRLNSHPEVAEGEEEDVRSLASDGFPSLEKTSSVKKKIAKAFRGKSNRLRRRSYETGSLSDLHFTEQQSPQLSTFPEDSPTFSEEPPSQQQPMSLPQSTLYGSRGIPLHHPRELLSGPAIRIDLSQFQLGVGLTPCSLETLGIVPARSLIKGKFGSLSSLVIPRSYSRGTFKQHYPPSSSSHSQPVIIRGIVPGSPVGVTRNLHEGDTIRSVNGHSVNLDNIDSVLAGLSNELQLTVKRGPSYEIPSPYHSHANHTPSPGGLVRLVMGGRSTVRSHVCKLVEHPHILLYLTLDTNEDDPEGKDILYQFPSPSSHPEEEGGERMASMQRRLVKLRGLFLTLSDVLGSLVGPAPSCSTILLEDHLIHVGYTQFDKELLLLAFPADRVSQYEVQLIVENTKKLLVLLYGSVNRAFTNPTHHSNLDHLFALMFDLVLGSPTDDESTPAVAFSSSPLPGLPSAPQLKIPADVRARLSTALSGLDSADHNNRPEILNLRRPFLLLGSCLFYRGALACSHLPDKSIREVVRFCQAYRLLELTAVRSINQVVIWREVYLRQLQTSVEEEEEDEVYSPHNGRTFLLIVGLEHTLVCLLMQQTELHPAGEVAPPTIDAVYVDRARSLISELKAEELLAECEGRGLHSTPLPALKSADIALASVYTKSASFHGQSSLPPRPPGTRKLSEPTDLTPLKRRKSSIGTAASSRQPDGSDSDEPKQEVFEKSSVLPRRRTQSFLPIGNPIAKQKRKMSGPDLQSIDEASVKTLVAPANAKTFRPAYMLTSGIDNILLHYVNLSPGRGGIICPTYATPPGPIQSELLQCFRQTCLSVRRVLRGRVMEGVSCVESDSDSGESDWEDDEESDGIGGREFVKKREEKALESPFAPLASSVVEHGVLFHCKPSSGGRQQKQSAPTLCYWVVGRLIRDSDTELYVCFQENMSQNLIEMSFRLLFGWPR